MANGFPGAAEATASPDFEKAAEGTIFQEFAHKVAQQFGQELVETLCQAIAKVRGGAGADALEHSVKKVVNQMAQHLAGTLCWEHQRHIEQMFSEVLRLRSELSRVAELMQGYLQRERQLQDMLDQLSKTPFNNADETALQMATNYREAPRWPSTAQADKDGFAGQLYARLQGGPGPVVESDELQAAFQEPRKAPVTVIAGATPSSSATLSPAYKDAGYQRRSVEIPQVAEPAASTLCDVVQRESSVLSSANLAGCQSRISQLADLLRADSSSGSTRVPGSFGAPAVASSPDDLSRSTQTVSRNLLVDGFNQALGAAEFSLEMGRSAAELRPKLAELRQDLQSYMPKQRSTSRSTLVGPARSPRQGTATPPSAASTFQLSASWRTISPAPRAVSPVQQLQEVCTTPASPRFAPPLVISAIRKTPPVTSAEMLLQSPPSGLRVAVSPSTPPPPGPFPLPPRLHHGFAVAPPSSTLFSPACLGSSLSPAHPGNGLQMDLGMPSLWPPPSGDSLTASLRALQTVYGPPADDALTASQRALQHHQTPQRQRTPPSQQAAGVSPVYC